MVGGLGLIVLLGFLLIPDLLKPALPESISLSLSSVPSNAKIFLDDQDIGQVTPARLPEIKLNISYQLKLKAPGYEEKSHTFSITPKQFEQNKNQEIKLWLERSPGVLQVTSVPSAAKVYLNKEYLGTTPLVKKNIPREEGDLVLIVRSRDHSEPKRLFFQWKDENGRDTVSKSFNVIFKKKRRR